MNIDFYRTRERAQATTRMNLFDPATGKRTDDYLEIRSSLSDEFLEQRDLVMQAAHAAASLDPAVRRKAAREGQLNLRVALVAGWSFDEEFNEDSVRSFLRDAPQLQDMILQTADDTARFFGQPSETSLSGPEKM